MLRQLALITATCSCAPAGSPVSAPTGHQRPAPRPIGLEISPYRTEAQILWEGRALGEVSESLVVTESGYLLTRAERLRFRRRNTPADLSVTIEILTDHELAGHRATVKVSGPAGTYVDRAERSSDGSWRIERPGLPVRHTPGDAVPIELVPLLMTAGALDNYDGPVMLSGRAFARAHFVVSRSGDAHEAKLLTPAGTERYRLDLAEDGFARRIDGPGPLATVPRAQGVELPGAPPEVVASSAIPISGTPGPVLVMSHVDGAAPDRIPGQTIVASDGNWTVTFEPVAALAGSRLRELETLVAITAERLADDLSTSANTPLETLQLDRGDCTAHALLFSELASGRGIESRLVTGYRIDGSRMYRHRWALARIGQSWIAVDPTFAEAPATSGRLVALFVHSAEPADIAIADFAFAATRAATARYR